MPDCIEARTDHAGELTLPPGIELPANRRVMLVVLDEPPATSAPTVTRPRESADPNLTPAWSGAATTGALRYRLDRELADGGMGQTYIGTDLVTGKAVCVKRLRPGVSAVHFEHEWRALARVQTPYAVRYLDRYEHGGVPYLVMEYVHGRTLRARFADPLSLIECVWLGIALASAAEAFHEVGVVHCDLKPANVLIEQTSASPIDPVPWVPRVIDFGIAILDQRDAHGEDTGRGNMAGTPEYMAPEQVLAAKRTPACDVYAIGQIVWEALSGRSAFPGRGMDVLLAKRDQAHGLRAECPRFVVPWELEELIERATHPVPEKRFNATVFRGLLAELYFDLDK